MKRLLLTAAAIALAAATFLQSGERRPGRFDQPLSPDRQIIHALNRLAFGFLGPAISKKFAALA